MELCQNCHTGHLIEPPNGQQSYLKCDACNAILLLYKPMPHQVEYHKDQTKFKGFFGGYGSGKTVSTCQDVIHHILTTPNGLTLIGAQTFPQLEQTAMKEFFDWFPQDLIFHYSKQKNYVDVVNGHRVLFRTLDDETKARSLNLTCFWIEEANTVAYEYFTQLQTRLRNTSTKKHRGFLSSNPDLNWIKTDFLLKSETINQHGYNDDNVIYLQDVKNPAISSHIVPTHLNKYLPENYERDLKATKPDWWIRRFLYGSFENREGLVYPAALDFIVEPFEIPNHWERIGGADFGILDPTVLVLGAIDPDEGILYLYDEHYQADKPVPHHAQIMNAMLDPIPNGALRAVMADPSGRNRNKHDGRTLFQHYAEYGIYFQPAGNSIDSGIAKVLAYFSLERIRIFNNLFNTIKEFTLYKFKPKELGDDKNADEKPEDKWNHAMDSIRYLVSILPDNPENLRNGSYGLYKDRLNGGKMQNIPYELQDEDNAYSGSWASNF